MVGPVPEDTPVGTPFMRILNHLTLACGYARVWSEGSERVVEMMLLIWGAASWRECGVEVGPPVTTKLPLAVHYTAASSTCGGEMLRSP